MLACANTPDAKELVSVCNCLEFTPPCHIYQRLSQSSKRDITRYLVPPAPPNPDAVTAMASVDGEHMLAPPGSAVALQDSDSLDKSTESDDGSEEDTETTPSTLHKPSGHAGSAITQPDGQMIVPMYTRSHLPVFPTAPLIAAACASGGIAAGSLDGSNDDSVSPCATSTLLCA